MQKPIGGEDNQIAIGDLQIIKDRKILGAKLLNFDSKECLVSWLTKNLNRPTLIVPPGQN